MDEHIVLMDVTSESKVLIIIDLVKKHAKPDI